jgi:hypothetical protein
VLLSRLADVAAFVGWMRRRADLSNVPVLAVVAHPSEDEFRRAFGAGADGVLVRRRYARSPRRRRAYSDGPDRAFRRYPITDPVDSIA